MKIDLHTWKSAYKSWKSREILNTFCLVFTLAFFSVKSNRFKSLVGVLHPTTNLHMSLIGFTLARYPILLNSKTFSYLGARLQYLR